MYDKLVTLVEQSVRGGVERVAISSNGSFPLGRYKELIDAGVNDFSISLDACCASTGEKMCGGIKCAWQKVVSNIEAISKLVYTTVGVVLTDDNISQVSDIIKFADGLGVADIRIISAAQFNKPIEALANVSDDILNRHPILKYRVENFRAGKPIRGIGKNDSNRCHIAIDDMAVAGKWHFPCIIALREGCNPIGEVGDSMRAQRAEWSRSHDTHLDPICKKNCLDCIVLANNKSGE